MRTQTPYGRRRVQRGFSMVELMVALGIGSLLTLVVAQLFSNTRSTNRAQEEAARMQENTRFALDTITRTVRLAGYKSTPTAVTTDIFDVTAAPPRPALGGSDGAAPASDTLVVRHQGGGTALGVADNSVLNCLGAAVAPDFAPATTSAYNSFSISPGADLKNALFCQANAAGAGPGTELVSGVEAMQVLFGEDTNADSVPDRFIPPGTGGINPNNVVTVRIYLLMASSQGILIGPQTVYTLGGVTYTPLDQRLYRVVTTTVALRNRVP